MEVLYGSNCNPQFVAVFVPLFKSLTQMISAEILPVIMDQVQSWLPREEGPNRSVQSHPTTVFTNIYEVRLDRLPSKLWLYLPPSHKDQAYEYASHCRQHRNHPDHFYIKIGYLCRYKKGFLGTTQIDQALHIRSISATDSKGQKQILDVPLSSPEEVSLAAILAEDCGYAALKALIGPAMKRSSQKKEISSNIYSFQAFQFKSSTQYILKLTRFNNKIWLTTDTRVRVQQHCTLLHYLLKYNQSEAPQLLQHARVIKTYGDRQSFIITDIDYSKNPKSIMPDTKETYQQYYLRKYQIQINNLTQPLLTAVKHFKENNKSSQIVLIPQLTALQDRSRRPDYPRQLDRKINSIKQLAPSQKETYISDIINSLSAEDIIKKSALKLEAVALSTPTIAISNAEIQPEEGVFEFRNKILFSPELRSWAVAYSLKDSDKDKEQSNELIGYFRNLTRVFGVNILSNPSEITIPQTDINSWKVTLSDNFKKFGKLQIIMLLLRQEEESLYNQLKEFVTIKLQCISQVIKKTTLFGPNCKKPYMIATDIMIQMITKVGATPWKILQKKTPISSSLFVQGGLIVKEDNGNFEYWFVGFTNKESTQIHSSYKANVKNSDDLKNVLANVFLGGWAKKFVVNHRQPPQTIIIFRESCPSCSADQKNLQIGLLNLMVKKIGQKMKKPDYHPTIIYIEVQQQQDIEIYSREESSGSLSIKNVDCGTAVFEESGSKKQFCFYLNAKSSLNKAAKPVRFRVTSSNEKFSKEEIGQFTYEQCYNYYNYQGSMSIPSTLQYAKKLKSAVQHFKQDNEPVQLSAYPYFL